METSPEASFVTSLATSTTSSPIPVYEPYLSTTSPPPPPVAALTTQFAAPTNCFDNFHLANYTVTSHIWISKNVTILNANTTGIYSSECWPSGFRTTIFRPAVCPSGWTYYDISSQYAPDLVTVADCCASGFTRTKDQGGERNTGPIDACFQEVKSTSIVAIQNDYETVTFTSGYLAHEPLRIQWDGDNATTLTPEPPTLEYNRFIKTWVPGEKAKLSRAQNMEGDSDNDPWRSLVLFLEIGLPIIIIFFIGCCIGCCVRHSRNKKRRRAAREAKDLAQAQRAAVEMEENIAAVEASLVAEEYASRELAAAEALVQRQQQTSDGVQSSTPSTTNLPPKYSLDGVEEGPPPTYQKHATRD